MKGVLNKSFVAIIVLGVVFIAFVSFNMNSSSHECDCLLQPEQMNNATLQQCNQNNATMQPEQMIKKASNTTRLKDNMPFTETAPANAASNDDLNEPVLKDKLHAYFDAYWSSVLKG